MPTKRPSDTPQKARKRPRVPKFNEGNNEDEVVRVRVQEEDEDEDVQADYMEEGGYFVEDIYIPPKLTLTERPTRGERLIIEKIECENFKSYGGIKVMGPFHKSFSAIVGPNGNGKSNIIDAMLFVFGYRAKKIRCKKVSVLIHKSELLPQVSSCAVTVHFVKIIDNGDEDPSDEINIVPNSKITVCRRAYQNNSSAYWLNQERVQFTEVATFLKQNGIDIVHNRFLILQGEVEQIAQMPPKATNTHETGFLEFIDEIIGTKRYEKPLDQLKTLMGVIEAERDDKCARVTLAQQHRNGLEEPMKKAKAYLRDQNTKKRINHKLNQLKAYRCRLKLSERTEKLKELEENRNTIISRLDEIKTINDARHAEYAEAEKVYQIAEAKYKKNKKAMDDADAKYVQLNREIKTSNDERKKKLKDIEKVNEELEKLQGLPQRHAAEIEKLENRKAELDAEIESEEKATKGAVESLMKQVDQCVAEKKVADAEFRNLKSVFDEFKANRDTLQKELDRSKANEATEKAKLDKLQQELQELQQTVKRKSGEGLNIHPNLIPEKEANAQTKREQAQDLLNSEHEKRAVFQRLRSKYADAQDSMDGGMITDKIDKALFAAKDRGSFPGLYGRLKDLATIDEKYNIAATVASGMLDYWVVDTDSTGAECIQYLKDQRLPAQTFVCVNKMGNLRDRCRQAFRTPADSLRIYDLLKIVKPELAPVFYKGYYDTLVAENIDVASKVAYGGSQRHRVVSCQGDIIEPTGSLLGGGSRVTEGKFNSGMAKRLGGKISKQELDALKRQCEGAETELQNVMEQRKALEDEASCIEKEIQEIKMKTANYQSDLEASRKMIPYKAALIKEQEQKVKATTISERMLRDKTNLIEKADADLETAKEPYDEAEEKAQALAGKVKSLQDDKKKEVLKKLNKFKDQKKKVLEELSKLNVELRNCEKNKTKLEVKGTKQKEDVEALQKKMLAMVGEKKELEAVALQLKEEEKNLRGIKEEKEQVYTEQKTKGNEFDQEQKKLNKQKVTADNNHQAISEEIRVIQKEERNYITSLKAFELDEIIDETVEPLEICTDEQLEEANSKELEARLHKYTQKLNREQPNLNILDDFKIAVTTLQKRLDELDATNLRREKINEAYLTLEAQRMKEFMDGYAMISAKVKELFRMISMGGDAELDLLDSTDPFSCGIDFSVRPRGKTWKKIINLSGGEKTLSSLALVFSLHHFKPSPFYVMDEIDAALDFQNVSIIANYIKDRTKFTQFVIISLRSNMFELADSLLGVYKVDNMSYSIRMGVNCVLQKLKDVHKAQNKQFLMGSNDDTNSTRKQQTTLSSQASTQIVQSQSNASKSPTSKQRPELDISAIQDHEDACSVETEQVSAGSQPASTTDVIQTNAEPIGNGNDPAPVDVEISVDEVMDISQDLFNDSYVEEERLREAVPIAASTPFVTAPKQTSLRKDKGELHQGIEENSEEDSDTSNASEIFASLNSSASNSQSQQE